MSRFLLGVNYWPRTSAMAMWSRFDADEIDEDFARIAAMGLDVVRFFVMWEAFQPSYDRVDRDALERFEIVLDRLAAHRLRGLPTLFTGHMSGVNWLPEWTLDRSLPAARFRSMGAYGRSPYGIGYFYCGDLLDAQRTLARALGRRARDHVAMFAWDLGNEFSNLRPPRDAESAAHWSAALTYDLFESSNFGATAGLHGEDLTEDRHLRPSSIAQPWRFATMHGYPVYAPFARDRSDPEVVPFLYELTSSFSEKRVLFSELGNPTCERGVPVASAKVACLSEEEMAVYARAVLDRLQRRGAIGGLWWCWADYARELAGSPPFDAAPHELTFGLVRNDGSEKPVAEALRRFAAEHRAVREAPASIAEEKAYYEGLPRAAFDAYDRYRDEHALSEEVS